MSNPHYNEDLLHLDGHWEPERVLGLDTIFVVTGCGLASELLDRPVAELLRDEIDRRGFPLRMRRAVVVGDLWWSRESDESLAAISVGGPGARYTVLTKSLSR